MARKVWIYCIVVWSIIRANIGSVGAKLPANIKQPFIDPYPEIFPSIARPKNHIPAQTFTGDPNREGDEYRGWVTVGDQTPGPIKPYPPEDPGAWNRSDTVLWVGISSFRDDLCGKTLFRLFSKAANPSRLRVAIVDQREPSDVSCVDQMCHLMLDNQDLCHTWRRQVFSYNVPSKEAKGPVFARAIQSRMVPDEAYFCMQIDSHMDLSQSWDRHLSRFWRETNNEFAVLSTYVADLGQLGKCVANHFEVPHLCQIMLRGFGVPRNTQAKAARMLDRPVLTTLWAAGLSFARCHFERLVPNDPNLPYVFDGEEFSRTLRGFTWGYDVYTPPRTVVGHNYHRPRKGHWSYTSAGEGDSHRRLQQLFGLTASSESPWESSSHQVESASTPIHFNEVQSSAYGLGPHRSIRQFINFSGINLLDQKANGHAKCADVVWTPWLRPLSGKADTAVEYPPPLEGSLAHLTHQQTDPALGGTDFPPPPPQVRPAQKKRPQAPKAADGDVPVIRNLREPGLTQKKMQQKDHSWMILEREAAYTIGFAVSGLAMLAIAFRRFKGGSVTKTQHSA